VDVFARVIGDPTLPDTTASARRFRSTVAASTLVDATNYRRPEGYGPITAQMPAASQLMKPHLAPGYSPTPLSGQLLEYGRKLPATRNLADHVIRERQDLRVPALPTPRPICDLDHREDGDRRRECEHNLHPFASGIITPDTTPAGQSKRPRRRLPLDRPHQPHLPRPPTRRR